MKSLFDGLDQFGMDDMDALDLFEDKKDEPAKQKIVKKEIKMEDLLYDRTIICPVCDSKFMARTVKNGMAKLEGTSLNLKPIYSRIDPILYDVISCNQCGYTALNRNYKKISDRQRRHVKEKIAKKYVKVKYPEVYDYEIALKRYKMALYNDVVISRTDVNLAYVCLKTSWVIEGIIEKTVDETRLAELDEERVKFAENAYKGFVKAYDKLSFPVFGMNEATYHYLLGALAFEIKDIRQMSFWLSKVLGIKSGHARLKDKARELRDIVKADNIKNEEG